MVDARMKNVTLVLLPEDLVRLDELVEGLQVRGVVGKGGVLMDRSSLVQLAVLLLYRMTLAEISRLIASMPPGPLAVWSDKPPPRTPRPPTSSSSDR
jgi:hypothetical protein